MPYLHITLCLLIATLTGAFCASIYTPNPEDNVGLRLDLMEGDIRIKPVSPKPGQVLSVITQYVASLWPGKIIPYKLDSSAQFSTTEQSLISAAASLINALSCVTWRPATASDNYYVMFYRGGGCWSYIGYVNLTQGYQEVSLDTGCFPLGTVVHEMLHACGFWHEQSRFDRDYYLNLNFQNIQSGYAPQFRKTTLFEMQNTAPYDYSSVMHYGAYAFSKNTSPTMVATISGASFGQRGNISDLDVWKLNNLYSCPGIKSQPAPPNAMPVAQSWSTGLPLSCDFESSLCTYFQDLTDQLDWNRYTGLVPYVSSYTGPSGDHTSGSGIYIYLPTEQAIAAGNLANLYTYKFNTKAGCLQYYYNMFGQGIGSLLVYLVPVSGNTILLSNITGNQTNNSTWVKKQVAWNLTSAQDVRVMFQGTTGIPYYGDMALDDISLWEGSCQSGYPDTTSSPPTVDIGLIVGIVGGVVGVVAIVLGILFGLKVI